jgi:hypothetical protein
VLPELAAALAVARARPPSLATWRRLTAALDATPGHALADAMADVEEACAGWPDALRLVPGRWLRELLDGDVQPRLRVARAIDLLLNETCVRGDRFAWTDAPELARATIVRVFDDRLGDAGLHRWLRSQSHSRIVELALATGIADAGAAALAGEPRLAGLRSLALFRNAIGPAGISALLTSPHLGPGLRRLLLGRNMLGETGARALARPTQINHLELLDLDCNRLDAAAVRVLADAPLLDGVRALNLSNNPIGADGCAALAQSPRLGALEVLYLHDCGLDDAAVLPLLRAPWLANLQNIALSANALSLATVARLAERRELALHELDICHNRFAESEAEPLLRAAPQFAGLRRLCL